ncbi:MAG: peptidylprolyl isomerase [Acidobacteriota bacterium]|nr:peptidylprolyl isomerase [Acidobacteriota bacterium]
MKVSLSILFLTIAALSAFGLSNDPETDQYFDLAGDFAASHILISHKGAERARPDVTRSKKDAEKRAREVINRLIKNPGDFEELARIFSDGPSGPKGGDLSAFRSGVMAARFEKALKELEIGDYTREPVKTVFGYHIIRRNPMRVKQYAARAILITFRGALPVAGLKNELDLIDEDDARKKLEEIRAQMTDDNFLQMAREHSHLAGTHAFLGVFRKSQSAVFDQIIATLETMEYDQVSNVVRLPVGYALLKRVKVEKLRGAQILISHIDAANVPEDILRIRKEARALAQKLCNQLQKDPKKFAKLAKKHSDDRYRVNGGLLPRWFYGYRDPVFDDAVKSLEPGTITSEPVETEEGFFIIRRDPDPTAK